ncbi:probable WRKY transcription factor 32 [Olea europaea subsp. europaea]|uniref:Probable WRKY transcription factor 32 n=1 Tax=Olea europaea subsp. europaea TaxID=158383 RepID=A0A8S0SZV5_OLEEU|nr:probable WRKY transcription factor 32 [Olea europaea subsp. europaea]
MLKTTSDGYNWRKYGQKQVKSPEGSWSYYRCTFSDCDARKIECCNQSNHVIETICRIHHNHDPPQKVNFSKERPELSVEPANGSNNTALAVAGSGLNDFVTTIHLLIARLKKNASDDSQSFSKPGKKPKFIVHATGDVGISGYGYRWCKYG